MYRKTDNCGLLNSQDRLTRSENPKAWGKRIVAQMKQDRIARLKVTYVICYLYLRSNKINLYGKNGPNLLSNLTPLRPVLYNGNFRPGKMPKPGEQ